jgi:hypothetical protein
MIDDPSDHATHVANSVLRAIGHDISRFNGIALNNTPMEDGVVLSFVSENAAKCYKGNKEFDRIKFVEYGLFNPEYCFVFKRIFYYSSGENNGRLALYASSSRSCIVNLDAILKQFEESISVYMIGTDTIFFENKKDMMFARAIIMSHINQEAMN